MSFQASQPVHSMEGLRHYPCKFRLSNTDILSFFIDVHSLRYLVLKGGGGTLPSHSSGFVTVAMGIVESLLSPCCRQQDMRNK